LRGRCFVLGCRQEASQLAKHAERNGRIQRGHGIERAHGTLGVTWPDSSCRRRRWNRCRPTSRSATTSSPGRTTPGALRDTWAARSILPRRDSPTMLRPVQRLGGEPDVHRHHRDCQGL